MNIVSVYEYVDYKKFVLSWLKTQPQGGRGFFTLLANKLGTSNAAISQIFKADRHLSLEQALDLSELLNLAESDSLYFLWLVEYARAGSVKLQKKLLGKIKSEQKAQQQLINRVPKDLTLTDELKSIYYSSWLYTGLRNLVATDKIENLEELALRLKVSPEKTQKALQFLIENLLIVREKGRLKVGPQKTHLESSSPWVIKHHLNWRLKAMEAMQSDEPQNLFYTGPMSLSKDVAEQIRQQLPEFIKQIIDQVGPSDSEVVRCLNIDWFEY